MPVHTLLLDGFWKLKGFAECNGEQLGAHKIEYNDNDWFPAKIPGTVHLDLLANKVIPDPFTDQNEKKVYWMPHNEWWYRKEVDLTPDFLDKQVIELVFNGLDTFASIWVNNVKVGRANNMFTPWRFNIKQAVTLGRNVIAVCFKPIYETALELQRQYGSKYGPLHAENFPARPYVRKAAYSFGWDWGPTLPTTGIWKSAKIIAYDKARLGYLAALPLQVSKEKAKIKLAADVYVAEPCAVNANFILEGFGKRIETQMSKQITMGDGYLETRLEISKPHLWWPRGYGAADLYDFSVELYFNDVFLDKAAVQCGIRSIELLQEPDDEGKSFTFAINGLPVFCKGADWIPADSFLPRVNADRYSKLLGLAAQANFNMLRVWGGGVYEDDLFYDLCDKLGIMVWQDFMYANAGYPEDDWFLKETEREADEVVRRLRGHACIVVWCGNNEIQWHYQSLWKNMPRLFGLQIYEKILPSVLGRLDGTRPYRPSTPYDQTDHNSEHEGTRHNWIVWSKQADYPTYLEDKGRFIPEFGWQAPPKLDLLNEYLYSSDMNLDSPALIAHEKQDGGLKILRTLLSLHYPEPEDFKQFTLYSQLNQADALKTAVTHWRTRMFKTSGYLIWQLNDCWPVISWSLIDYGLNPKAAYYAVKRVCQPVIAPLIVKDGKVYGYVVNETDKQLELTFRFEVIRFNGESLHAEIKNLTAPPYTSLLVIETVLQNLPVSGDCILTGTLWNGEKVLFKDSRTVQEPKDLKLPPAVIQVSVEKVDARTFEISIVSPVYVEALVLDTGCLKGMFSDNFFDIIPNELKTVTCKLDKDMTLSAFKEILWWQSYPYF